MARPLKQWLYKHRDNPYPTKTEKILLALGSQMTLVQVRPLLVILQTSRSGDKEIDGEYRALELCLTVKVDCCC